MLSAIIDSEKYQLRYGCICVLIIAGVARGLDKVIHSKHHSHSLWFGSNQFYPYSSGLLLWHWCNHRIGPVPVKQPWRIWINISPGVIQDDEVIKLKESRNVHLSWDILHIQCFLFQKQGRPGMGPPGTDPINQGAPPPYDQRGPPGRGPNFETNFEVDGHIGGSAHEQEMQQQQQMWVITEDMASLLVVFVKENRYQ